jgi:hypothetical protein
MPGAQKKRRPITKIDRRLYEPARDWCGSGQLPKRNCASMPYVRQRFWEEITFGGLSGASPIASLEGTRASFLAAAAQGDRGRIEDLGRQLLTQSRGAFASGGGFQSDLELVRGIVEPLVLANDNAVVNAINASGAENTRYQAQIVARLGALAEENAGMKEEIARLNSMLQRLLVKAA